MSSIRAVLFDLDGTIYEHGVALPGAAVAVTELRRRSIATGFVTNTTSRARSHLKERLDAMGIATPVERISTALGAGARYLESRGVRRIAPLVPPPALEDLRAFAVDDERPEAVVVGDLDEAWSFDILNRAFGWLMQGAELVALSRDRYWHRDGGLVLDCGPFVAALEYASGRQAALCGKPAAAFYRAALESLGPWALERPDQVLMVGDDIWGDIEGAQRAGLRACLVRTGKFRREVFEASGIVPELIVESVADLPTVLAP